MAEIIFKDRLWRIKAKNSYFQGGYSSLLEAKRALKKIEDRGTISDTLNRLKGMDRDSLRDWLAERGITFKGNPTVETMVKKAKEKINTLV